MPKKESLLDHVKRRRPAVINRAKHVLESETLESDRQIVETEKGKYVVETSVIRTVVQYITVREFDPEGSYADAVSEFIDEGDADA